MKLPTLILGVSLVANAALIATHFYRTAVPGAEGAVASDERAEPGAVVAATNATASASTPTDSSEAILGRGARARWSDFNTSDLKALTAQLHSAGYPKDLVRAIISVLISEQFAARRDALVAEGEDIPFWATGRAFALSGTSPEARAAMNNLSREQSKVFQEVIGTELQGSALAYYRRQYGELPPDKLQLLQKIRTDYGMLRSDILSQVSDGGTSILAANQDKLALLDREEHADMAAVLSPEEMFEYNIRSSNTASRLRSTLVGFSPTEEEFRAIFAVQRALDEQNGRAFNVYAPVAETAADRQREQDQLRQALQPVLSPERLADYTLATDPAYSMLTRITSRYGVPLDAVRQVAAAQKNYESQAAAARANQALSPPERDIQLRQLNEEANAKVNEALGPRATEAYREYGGAWLRPPPTRPSPAAR